VAGLGTTLSLLGAYVLAGEIARLYKQDGASLEVTRAAKNYEEKLRPLVAIAQSDSPSMMCLFMPKTKLGIKVFHTLAGLLSWLQVGVSAPAADKMMRWSVPAYPELDG
jgi:2-polyprenyl-6-methoxyphenol hydroxylase-like FAD-dependent oxidoreductase